MGAGQGKGGGGGREVVRGGTIGRKVRRGVCGCVGGGREGVVRWWVWKGGGGVDGGEGGSANGCGVWRVRGGGRGGEVEGATSRHDVNIS